MNSLTDHGCGAAAAPPGREPAPVTAPSPRVALLAPSLAGGGISTVLLGIARGLAGRGVAVDLVVFNPTGGRTGPVPGNVRLIDLGARRLVTALWRLVRYSRRTRPDLLVAAGWDAVLIALMLRSFFRRSQRVWVRQDGVFSMQMAHGGTRTRIILGLTRRLLPAADRVIAVSGGVARDLGRRVPRIAASIEVVANPLDHRDIAAGAALPVDHPWFEDPQVPVVLSAGRLVREKDHATLIRAFAVVRESVHARLVILGAGREKEALAALARELGVAPVVDFRGFVENPFAYMARARVFAVSSVCEGLGMALIEAMACGTPVVGTDCPHGPGEVLEAGRWGRLVPVGDAQALAQAIVETLRDPVAPGVLVSRSRAFAIEGVIDRHIGMLSEDMRRASAS